MIIKATQLFRDQIEVSLTDSIKRLCDPLLHEGLYYALLNGGKRLRPIFMLAIGKALNVEDHHLIFAATAVECMHAYSLVHDDLPAMDNADYRRGKPSCWRKFDEAQAILIGDALLGLSFEILCELPSPVSSLLIKELASACGPKGMVLGQFKDLKTTPKDLQELIDLHKNKTGALFAFCALAPSYFSTHQNLKGILSEFAYSFGLFYQIQDDLLDATSSADVLGKPIQSDINKGIFSHLSLLQTQEYVNKLYDDLLKQLTYMPGDVSLLKELLWLIKDRKN